MPYMFDREYVPFTDDFMFCSVLTANPQLAGELVGVILGKKVSRIEFVEPQKSVKIAMDAKGVRFDVYIEDEENTVYDIELQTTSQRDLAKRMRYYQGMIDLNLIQSGSPYAKLKRSYVIFICMNDPFGRNCPIYTFDSMCHEVDGLCLGDEATKVVVNAACTAETVEGELKPYCTFSTATGVPPALQKRWNKRSAI